MSVMQQVIFWFDASNIRYWFMAVLCIATVVFLSLFSAISGLQQKTIQSGVVRRSNHPLLYIFMMALALAAFRWPIIFDPYELNPDESQMIAQAMKFFQDDPIPWRSVDGGSGGPLDSYVLVIPALLGFHLDYAAARVIGLLCITGTLSFTFLTLRVLFSDGLAKVAVIPMMFFFCFTRFFDFIHYSSEHLPILLLSAAVYLLVKYIRLDMVRKDLLFLSGVALGSVPYAKLQTAPVAVIIFLGVAAAVFIKEKGSGVSPTRQLTAFCCGILLMPAVISGVVLWGGAFGDFWKSYIVSSLIYNESAKPLLSVAAAFIGEDEFFHFLAGNIFFLLMAIVFIFAIRKKKRPLAQLLVSFIYLSANIYIVLKPGRLHYHYLLFLIPPLSIMSGVLLGNIAVYLTEHQRIKLSIIFLMCFLGITTIFQIPRESEYYDDDPFAGHAADYFTIDRDPVVSSIRSIANPSEKMAIWGWTPKYFVLTGLVPGTRDAAAGFQIGDSPLRDYYRQRFLQDLKAERPPVFMDTVSSMDFAFSEREKFGHETFKELADFIRDSYTLSFIVGPGPDDAVRIYALNGRLRQPADRPPD